jgi:hypothetical protein
VKISTKIAGLTLADAATPGVALALTGSDLAEMVI